MAHLLVGRSSFVKPKDKSVGILDGSNCNFQPSTSAAISEKSSGSERSANYLSGSDARRFYETVLKSKTDKTETLRCSQKRSLENFPKKRTLKKSRPKHFPNPSGSLLKAATEGNAPELHAILEVHPNLLNFQDEFGWSSLMCATFEGNFDIVQELLAAGANTALSNRRKQTAADLANSKGFTEIADYIDNFQYYCLSQKQLPETKTFEDFCDECGMKFSDCKHHTSTAHVINSTTFTETPSYSIPESNLGYKLMKRTGWDEKSGLGRTGSGRKFPVKTILKRDREGLGVKKLTPRVSHFGPNDARAVAQPEKIKPVESLRVLKRKEIDRKAQKERNISRNFRREFYGED